MNLGELIALLQEMHKIAPDDTSVNVNAVSLKGNISTISDDMYGGYGREEKRSRSLTVWLDSYKDGPSAPTCPDPTAHYAKEPPCPASLPGSDGAVGNCQWATRAPREKFIGR